ncbi:CAF17-like 4Fe-4S cluster assembly/insertion protein YgfZ [Natronospira bacteriovora]|uniref:Aminomethyltransferase folate-binding domain-containing protein n=1 Tax=Natronospira bacteriovora TaxID=3069753 RepID=A0ABU0W312_9GAMM|nr:hypothetical protein [Natronospira sp. AB-CW4]MDQ2068303.1 hypothetical protein [Natronospira sp. AB-CW4]
MPLTQESTSSSAHWNGFFGLAMQGPYSGKATQSPHRASFPAAGEPGPPLLCALTHLLPLAVTGADAEAFLDGQVSAAVSQLPDDRAVLTAWHDPKGRARTLLHLWRTPSGFCLLMPADRLEQLLPKLRMYILRSRVEITPQNDERAAMGLFGAPTESQSAWRLLEGTEHCFLRTASADAARQLWDDAGEENTGGSLEWRQREMLAGIPAMPAAASELFLPQFLDLDRFGGLSFRKGCYIGQEVIARTHYLGKVKQQLGLAQSNLPVTAGVAVRDGQGRRLGHVLDAVPTGSEKKKWLLQLVLRDDPTSGVLKADQEPPVTLKRISD